MNEKPDVLKIISANNSIDALNGYKQLFNKVFAEINSKSKCSFRIEEYYESYGENLNKQQLVIMENMMKLGHLKVGQNTVKHFVNILNRNERVCGSMKVLVLNIDEKGEIANMKDVIASLNEAFQDLLAYLVEQGLFLCMKQISLQQQNVQQSQEVPSLPSYLYGNIG